MSDGWKTEYSIYVLMGDVDGELILGVCNNVSSGQMTECCLDGIDGLGRYGINC